MKQVVGKKVAASEGSGVDTGRSSQHVADGAGSYFVQPIIEPIEVSIADVVMDEIDSSGPVDDFVYLDIGSVDREGKVFVKPKVISLTEAPSRAKQHVHAGDVLVSMTRPNLNAVAQVTQELHGSIASTGFHVLRSPWLEAGFLYYLVQTDSFVDAMCGVVQGALYPAVRPRDIDGFKFRLPPRVEQTRIVQKLEELLSDLDAGVAELKAAQRKLAQYRQSLLKAAVEGALTADWRATRAQSGKPQETGAALLQRILTERRTRWETRQLAKFAEQGKVPPKDWKAKYPKPVAPDTSNLQVLPEGWVWASVEQLAELISGHTPKDAGEFADKAGDICWFKVGDMNAEGNEEALVAATIRFSKKAARKLGLKITPVGTIVFPKRGGAIATNKKRRLAVAAAYDLNMMGLVPVSPSADWLWSWFIGVDLAKLSDGSNVPQINNPDIAPLCVPLPPVVEQTEIMAVLDTALALVKEQQAAIEIALKQSAAQRKNILKAAFAGQLVPQDPNDEPASVLLERIRAARDNQERPPARTRRTKPPKRSVEQNA